MSSEHYFLQTLLIYFGNPTQPSSQPRGPPAGHSTLQGIQKMEGEQTKINSQETQTKFNYGKLRTRYQKMRLKTGSCLLGRLPQEILQERR